MCRQGHLHDSKRESLRCNDLHLMLKTKPPMIKDLKQQPKFTLLEKFVYRATGKKIRAITYKADFSYWDNEKGIQVVEDCKGFSNNTYKLKKKMLLNIIKDSEILFIES